MTAERSSKKRVPWRLAELGALASALIIAACGQTYLDGILAPDAPGASGGDAARAEACEAGRVRCSHLCAPLAKDHKNCGQCGRACAAKAVCSQGACASQCSVGLFDCGGACVDLLSDRDDCGACGQACADGEVCSNGFCAAASSDPPAAWLQSPQWPGPVTPLL